MTPSPNRRSSHRWATGADIPAIAAIMDATTGELQRGFLTPEQITASRELMGLDTQLIDDGTYLVIEAAGAAAREANSVIVGCGGWSKRRTLFGANHTSGRGGARCRFFAQPADGHLVRRTALSGFGIPAR